MPGYFERKLFFYKSLCLKSRLFKFMAQEKFSKKIYAFIDKNLIIISPESHFKMLWDLIIIIILVFSIIFIPMQITFLEDPYKNDQ